MAQAGGDHARSDVDDAGAFDCLIGALLSHNVFVGPDCGDSAASVGGCG